MALTKNRGRQTVLTAIQHFTYADFTSGVALEVIDLPAGAHVLGGQLVITTAWNSATSAAMEVGDTVADDVDALLTSTNVKATGITDLVPYTGTLSQKQAVTIELTEVGAATAGAGYLVVQYVIDGRSNEVQP